MKSNSNEFACFLIFFAVFMAAMTGLGAYSQQKNLPVPAAQEVLENISQETEIDTEPAAPDTEPAATSTLAQAETLEAYDWKTYHNDEYGFEFKYPKEYKIDGHEIKLSDTEMIRIDTRFCCFPISLPDKQEKLMINGVAFEKISGTSVKDGNAIGIISYRTKSIQGKDMQIVLLTDLGKVSPDSGEGVESKEMEDIEARILDQMLSTFKFIYPPDQSIEANVSEINATGQQQ
jgi:hypothetical protein